MHHLTGNMKFIYVKEEEEKKNEITDLREHLLDCILLNTVAALFPALWSYWNAEVKHEVLIQIICCDKLYLVDDFAYE